MLDLPNLLSSKVRQKVFRLYFSQTNRRYYLRELERLLHEPVGNIRRDSLDGPRQAFYSEKKWETLPTIH